jgi:hypothetical protein
VTSVSVFSVLMVPTPLRTCWRPKRTASPRRETGIDQNVEPYSLTGADRFRATRQLVHSTEWPPRWARKSLHLAIQYHFDALSQQIAFPCSLKRLLFSQETSV